jgi:cytochrome b involved in lipid metabolism
MRCAKEKLTSLHLLPLYTTSTDIPTEAKDITIASTALYRRALRGIPAYDELSQILECSRDLPMMESRDSEKARSSYVTEIPCYTRCYENLSRAKANFFHSSPRIPVLDPLKSPGSFPCSLLTSPRSDYRNAIEWHQYDPTKWLIWLCGKLGLASGLKQFRSNEIEKGRVQQLQKKIDQKRAKLDWGVPLDQLPVIEWDDYVEQAKNGRGLIAVAGVVHDVTDFINEHPGGKTLIKSGIGKDATAMFNGGVYFHSNGAHNLLSTMRVGVIRGGCEVEIWKRAQKENKEVNVVKDDQGNAIIRAGNQITKVAQPIVSASAA